MKELPEEEVKNCVEQTIMFVRAGMTHLSADISNDSLSVIEWLLDVADEEIVGCPGGWVKTLSTFCAVMGWPLNSTKSGWSSAPRPSLRAKDATTQARQIAALSRFLRAGLKPEVIEDDDEMEYLDSLYRMPRASNTFEYLNLTGARRDEESEMYLSREARQGVFYRRFFSVIEKQVEQAKKEGGAMGRAAANLDEALTEGMGDYMPSTAMDTQDLLELW
jgi:pre-rRNA-processing protein IPI1